MTPRRAAVAATRDATACPPCSMASATARPRSAATAVGIVAAGVAEAGVGLDHERLGEVLAVRRRSRASASANAVAASSSRPASTRPTTRLAR